MWNSSVNVMLFDHIGGQFAILAQKVFIFDRFYKVFDIDFPCSFLPIKRNVLGDFRGFRF